MRNYTRNADYLKDHHQALGGEGGMRQRYDKLPTAAKHEALLLYTDSLFWLGICLVAVNFELFYRFPIKILIVLVCCLSTVGKQYSLQMRDAEIAHLRGLQCDHQPWSYFSSLYKLTTLFFPTVVY